MEAEYLVDQKMLSELLIVKVEEKEEVHDDLSINEGKTFFFKPRNFLYKHKNEIIKMLFK